MARPGQGGNRRTRSPENHHRHQLPPSDDPLARDRDGAISRYREWTDHRYDPGYYLGGRLPPLVRALQSRGPGAEMYGSVLIAFSLIPLLIAASVAWRSGLHSIGPLASTASGMLTGFLMLAAGVLAIRRARRRSGVDGRDSSTSQPPRASQTH
jgi:hypothetical protein